MHNRQDQLLALTTTTQLSEPLIFAGLGGGLNGRAWAGNIGVSVEVMVRARCQDQGDHRPHRVHSQRIQGDPTTSSARGVPREA